MAMQETLRGHEEPYSIQFSLFFANRVGQFKDLLDLCDGSQLQIHGLSIVDSCDWSVVRIVFSDPNKAREILTKYNVAYTESTVLLTVLPEGETLAHIFELLLRAEINMYFAYPLMLHHDGYPVMVIHVDDDVMASHLLTRHGLKLLGREDLADPR